MTLRPVPDRRWHLEAARGGQAGEAHAVMGIARRHNPDPLMYHEDSFEYVRHMFTGYDPSLGHGRGTVAVGDAHGRIVGVGIVRCPGSSPSNLGVDCGLPDGDLARVVHIEHVAVLPAWHGHGIGTALIGAGEAAFPTRFGPHIYLATVHPDNTASLAMFTKAGYEPVWEGLKYGGKPRLIVRKDSCVEKKAA